MRPVLALVLAALAGCAGAEAVTLPVPPATPFEHDELGLHPGESMAFELQLSGVVVGEAQLAVGEVGALDGRDAIVVKSRAATAGAAALVRHLVDEATSLIDVATARPRSVETAFELGDRRMSTRTTFGADQATVVVERPNVGVQTIRIPYHEGPLHDAHTAMAQLRGWKTTPGTTRTVIVLGGRRLWRVDVTYLGGEQIGTAIGNRRAVVYEGVSYRARRDHSIEQDKPARRFRVWLSDDADRVPLKVSAKTELGDVVVVLTDYQRP